MKTFSSKEIIERAKKSLNMSSDNELAEALKISKTTLSNWKSRNSLDFPLLFSICEHVDYNWLLTGNGSMLKSVPISESSYTSLTNTKTVDNLLDISEIPLYNIEASAGLSKLFAEGGELLGSIKIPNAPKCDGAVYVIGDSMYPLLKAGDIIAYRQVYNLESIVYGEIYLIQLYNEGDLSVVIKYVKRSEKGDTYIKLVSYNKEHDPKDIPLSWVQSIARVTFSIRKFSIT